MTDFRTVLIQGAFDILHVGHVRTFQFAKEQGDYLIVALNSNELIRRYKRRDPVMPWEDKAEIIRACRHVDRVIQADDFSPLELLKRHEVDIYVVAEEWVATKMREMAYMQGRPHGRVCISPRFAESSTTEIKAKLLAEHLDKTAEMA